MVSAADCETWLTLVELRAITRYGEASISAQLRHLRKAENGGYEIVKKASRGGPRRCGRERMGGGNAFGSIALSVVARGLRGLQRRVVRVGSGMAIADLKDERFFFFFFIYD